MTMNSIKSFIKFVIERKTEISDLLVQHIQLTVFSILMCCDNCNTPSQYL